MDETLLVAKATRRFVINPFWASNKNTKRYSSMKRLVSLELIVIKLLQNKRNAFVNGRNAARR